MKCYQWLLSVLLAGGLGGAVSPIATAQGNRYLKLGMSQYYEQPIYLDQQSIRQVAPLTYQYTTVVGLTGPERAERDSMVDCSNVKSITLLEARYYEHGQLSKRERIQVTQVAHDGADANYSANVAVCQRATPAATSTAATQPLTWEQFVQQGGSRYIQFDYALPIQFRQGFVYLNQGTNQISALILRQGLTSELPKQQGLNEVDPAIADQLVRSGQAITLNWNLSNSGLRFLNDPTVRFPRPGTGCFQATCLTAPFFSQAEIARIVRSQRSIQPKPR